MTIFSRLLVVDSINHKNEVSLIAVFANHSAVGTAVSELLINPGSDSFVSSFAHSFIFVFFFKWRGFF